jgi:hypothetical protein
VRSLFPAAATVHWSSTLRAPPASTLSEPAPETWAAADYEQEPVELQGIRRKEERAYDASLSASVDAQFSGALHVEATSADLRRSGRDETA